MTARNTTQIDCVFCGSKYIRKTGGWSGCCSARCRFMIKVDTNGPLSPHAPELGNCHLWTGAKEPSGYGRFTLNRRVEVAHRVAYYFHHGEWPMPLGRHLCGNGALGCVRWDHVAPGTDADNGSDMARHGTRKGKVAVSGEAVRNGQTPRFTSADILAIRQRAAAGPLGIGKVLAKEYGVAQTVISDILHGRRWASVRRSRGRPFFSRSRCFRCARSRASPCSWRRRSGGTRCLARA